ncbi:MAG: type II secretion system F family protein [Armatimonadetes bacterium]|nr:type II secretion system F family protein [Armatimonadota bacterium]
MAFRQLAVMVGASIPITRALEVLARMTPDRVLASGFNTVLSTVATGHSLSRGLARRADVFPDVVPQLVAVGENTGRLDDLLGTLATYLEKSARLRMRVRSALVYPGFMFGMCLLTILLVPSLLFASVFRLLEELGTGVPFITSVVMLLGRLMGSPWFYAAAGIAITGSTLFYRRWISEEENQLRRDRFLLGLWGVGSCLRYVAISLFALSLEAQVSSGIPIVKGLRAAGRAAGNRVLEQAAVQAAEAVMDGAELDAALAKSGFFPASFLHFMTAATQAGTVGEMLERITKLTDEEVDQRVGAAVAALEPAMLLVMGVLVGVIIIATLSPLLKVLESLTL